MNGRREWLAVGLITLGVLLVLGFLNASQGRPNLNYIAGVLLVICIYAIFALGMSLQFGYTGLLNFGHVAAMAIGAYTVAILVPRLQRTSLDEQLVQNNALGFAGALLAGALLGLLLLPPLNAAIHSHRLHRIPPRLRRALPALLGASIAIAAAFLMHPLNEGSATGVIVLLAILAGMSLAGLWGLLLGLPAVRLREDYLAIVTIGAAEILRGITHNEEWLTNGTLGIQSLERPVAAWSRDTQWWQRSADAIDVQPTVLAHATIALLLVLIIVAILQILAHSPWGRVLKAIREDETVASSLGKNVSFYKLQVLVLGSAIGALAGILFVWNLSNVYPEHFPNIITFYGFIILIIGGVGNHRGALVGTVILWGVFEISGSITLLAAYGLQNLAGPPQGVAVGLLLVLVMMFRPQGALGRKQEMLYVR